MKTKHIFKELLPMLTSLKSPNVSEHLMYTPKYMCVRASVCGSSAKGMWRGSIWKATQLCACAYMTQLVSAKVCVRVWDSEFVCASCRGYSEINTTNDYHFHKPPSTAFLWLLSGLQQTTPTLDLHLRYRLTNRFYWDLFLDWYKTV